MTRRSYSELVKIKDYHSRVKYLQVLEDRVDSPRSLMDSFYKSPAWKKVRVQVIIRDRGCDLGISDRPITDKERIIVHHMNPVTIEDIINMNPCILDPEYLITTTADTHNTIHYRNSKKEDYVERKEGDTKLW